MCVTDESEEVEVGGGEGVECGGVGVGVECGGVGVRETCTSATVAGDSGECTHTYTLRTHDEQSCTCM